VDRSQREYYLREQLKAIQTELGDGDPWTRELNELRSRIEGVSLPDEARVRVIKEIDRLSPDAAHVPGSGNPADLYRLGA